MKRRTLDYETHDRINVQQLTNVASDIFIKKVKVETDSAA